MNSLKKNKTFINKNVLDVSNLSGNGDKPIEFGELLPRAEAL